MGQKHPNTDCLEDPAHVAIAREKRAARETPGRLRASTGVNRSHPPPLRRRRTRNLMAPRGGHAAAAASSGSEDDDEEAGFSRSYFLAKEKEPSSSKKRARAAASKLSDLNLVDEQVRCPALNHFLTSRSTNPWVRLTDLLFSAGAACIPRRDPPKARGRGGGPDEKLQGAVPQMAV
jgi:hypothetical protein